MPGYEIQTSQCGVVEGERQPTSNLVAVVMPRTLFSPEARKGCLCIVVETNQPLTGGKSACELVHHTIRKTFYDDRSLSVTSSLREAIRVANRALYQHNVNLPAARRVYMGVTCVVLKDRDIFVAQVAPTQMYLCVGERLRVLPEQATWLSPHVSVESFFKAYALGSSLTVEPELYRNPARADDTVVVCSSVLTPLLRGEDVCTLLRQQPDAEAVVDGLYALCQQHNLGEAHALAIKLLALPHGRRHGIPTGDLSVGEHISLALQATLNLPARLVQELAQRGTGRHQHTSEPAEPHGGIWGQTDPADDPLGRVPDQPDHSPHPIPRPGSIDVGISLNERHEREQQTPSKPGRSARVLRQPVDLGDTTPRFSQARPYRPRLERRPFDAMNWHERLLLPFRLGWHALINFFQRRPPSRKGGPPLPRSRAVAATTTSPVTFEMGNKSYQERPRFPWLVLLVLILSITSLVLYGTNLSRQMNEQRDIEYMNEATKQLADMREASNMARATDYLEKAEQALEQLRASPLITRTNSTLWLRFQKLEKEYERGLGMIKRQTFFEEPVVLASHPLPNGHFTSVVAPPVLSSITSTHTLEALSYVYALDSSKDSSTLYRIPRAGGRPETFLRSNQDVQAARVGSVQAQAWRIDNIVVVDESTETNSFGYYFRDQGTWNYTRLGGSEIWVLRGRLDMETYQGNLYFWGAEVGEIVKFTSGHYGDLPQLWLETKDFPDVDITTAIDMAIDGNIYLLLPNGHILLFHAGSLERTIVPRGITPPLTSVTRFFVTGTAEQGAFYLLDTLQERIIQIDKNSGSIIQQVGVRPGSPIRLNQLTGLYVEEGASLPVLYLANGNQIIRATLPPPPPQPPFALPTVSPEASETTEPGKETPLPGQ